MKTKDLIKALRDKESRDNRALIDEAAERLELLSAIVNTCRTYRDDGGELYINATELVRKAAQMAADHES